MIIQNPLLVIAFAGLLHASFQLSMSLLTLLSGHSLGAGKSFRRLMQLNLAYLLGAALVTTFLLTSLGYIVEIFSDHLHILWVIATCLNIVVGISVTIFYYRRGMGTGLWIPRSMALYLTERTKKTKSSAESFTLGAGSILAELPFLIGPLTIATLYIVSSEMSVSLQLASLVIYVLIALLPLLIIVTLVGAGHKISTIQRWREDNKLFLQYCAGSGLIILGCFVLIDQVIGRGL